MESEKKMVESRGKIISPHPAAELKIKQYEVASCKFCLPAKFWKLGIDETRSYATPTKIFFTSFSMISLISYGSL